MADLALGDSLVHGLYQSMSPAAMVGAMLDP